MAASVLSVYGTLLVGFMTMAAVFAVVMALRPVRDPVAQRLDSHVRVDALEAADLERPFWDRAVLPFMRGILGALGRLSPRGNIERQRRLLLLAGNPGDMSVLDLLGLKVLLGAAGLTVAARLLVTTVHLDLTRLALIVLAPVVGYYLPTYWLKRKVKERKHLIERSLPDVLDMLTICVESGLALEAAMLRVGDQWDNLLTRELRRTVREVRMGVARPEALRHLVERTQVSALTTFVAVVVQAEQLGVSIANVLRAQADQMRIVRWQRAEERARSAPFKMVFALVFLTFPSLFIVILGPSIPRFQDLFSTMGR
ncbi:MAG: type II secretion system F family protein [Anaerolineae bacterium]